MGMVVCTVRDGAGCGEEEGLFFFQILYTLFLLPKYVLDLLRFVQTAIDADVGIVIDLVADLTVVFFIAGGVIA
jgi:hypothetical protein